KVVTRFSLLVHVRKQNADRTKKLAMQNHAVVKMEFRSRPRQYRTPFRLFVEIAYALRAISTPPTSFCDYLARLLCWQLGVSLAHVFRRFCEGEDQRTSARRSSTPIDRWDFAPASSMPATPG